MTSCRKVRSFLNVEVEIKTDCCRLISVAVRPHRSLVISIYSILGTQKQQ